MPRALREPSWLPSEGSLYLSGVRMARKANGRLAVAMGGAKRKATVVVERQATLSMSVSKGTGGLRVG